MLHAICDFCGKDTDRSANLITITPFQNFARYHGDNSPYGSEGPSRSFIICSTCLAKHKLPNPFHDYQSITDQQLSYQKTLDNYKTEDFQTDVRALRKPPAETEADL